MMLHQLNPHCLKQLTVDHDWNIDMKGDSG